MMTQTLALLLDAYRELNSKKMFWIVLILGVLIMGAFSVIGANDHTITVLWFEPFGNVPDSKLLYKTIFSYVVVGVWLTWIASLLALISTAGIFPDFLASGSVDLYLAKPITRIRLFFTKYLAGLLFVALQVTLFAFMSFIVLGLRGGAWEPGLFWAIPLVILFFSYLFSVCTLLGVLTRSTVAALMLTLLAWFGIWAVDYVDYQLRSYTYIMAMQTDMLNDRIDDLDAEIAARQPESGPATTRSDSNLDTERTRLVSQRNAQQVPPMLISAQHILYGIKSFVPKTRETINLLDRVLFQDKELQDASKHADQSLPTRPAGRPGRRNRGPSPVMQFELDRQRPVWWIIGTSLVFEAVALVLAAWRFCTRDY